MQYRSKKRASCFAGGLLKVSVFRHQIQHIKDGLCQLLGRTHQRMDGKWSRTSSTLPALSVCFERTRFMSGVRSRTFYFVSGEVYDPIRSFTKFKTMQRMPN